MNKRQVHVPSTCGLALMAWYEHCDCPWEMVVEKKPNFNISHVYAAAEVEKAIEENGWPVVQEKMRKVIENMVDCAYGQCYVGIYPPHCGECGRIVE